MFARRRVGGSAAVQEIRDWLEKLGMPEYGERFAENGIDVANLVNLGRI
jgi:hypothetical protein